MTLCQAEIQQFPIYDHLLKIVNRHCLAIDLKGSSQRSEQASISLTHTSKEKVLKMNEKDERMHLPISQASVISALTFRVFVSRLELLTLFRNFRKGLKMSKMNDLFIL